MRAVEVKNDENILRVALAGNPNVGKSTLFNRLTGMKQHTGNWTGKTVGCASGNCIYKDKKIEFTDLPGVYSLSTRSAEEELASEYIHSGIADITVVVCDATCLERNLIIALQILAITKDVVLCVNLCDEAKKRGISINTKLVSERLGVPVIDITARNGKGVDRLLDTIIECNRLKKSTLNNAGDENENHDQDFRADEQALGSEQYVCRAEEICLGAIDRISIDDGKSAEKIERRASLADRILTGRISAYPVMLLMLGIIVWLTAVGANYPSDLIFKTLFDLGDSLYSLMSSAGVSTELCELIVSGVYKTTAWVVSVMLPPMAIFFPLFTLLEDWGLLPRVAFNLDRCFQCCGSCGKQALTMCMGLGCNAVGVTGCRIVDSPRERKIAMLTNVFMPCNGKIPSILALSAIFWSSFSGIGNSTFLNSAMLTFIIVVGIATSMLLSRALSSFVYKGERSSFILEIPPFRRPQIAKVITRSMIDRTLFVLGRAVAVAAPAGLVIWICANMHIGDTSLIRYAADFLDPVGRFLGLDGVILLAFLLGLPANEIVLPLIIMLYTGGGSLEGYTSVSGLADLLMLNGWSLRTVICTTAFMMFHWPCSTTIITIKKEGGSALALLGIIIPTVLGIAACALLNIIL